jgi:tripartite-type tricarboxylate transporter receptor subunit TctC
MLIGGGPAAQTSYPEKPIRIIVGFPPGAQIDTVARMFAQKFAEAWGRPVVVENLSGVAGNIATERVAHAAPDGYTLGFLGQAQLAVNPKLYADRARIDPVRDFAPISQVYASPNILVVHNAVPAKSVKDLVALAKAQPGALTYASFGSGSPPHIAAELFKSTAGIDVRHVPYKGPSGANPDLLSGRVTMAFGPIGTFLPLVREGKLHALGVTSPKRSEAAAELPTIAESGYPGFEVTIWAGLLAPAKTPATIVEMLHHEMAKAIAMPELRAKLAGLGLEPIGSSPDAFAALIKQEIQKWARVIEDSGIRPD